MKSGCMIGRTKKGILTCVVLAAVFAPALAQDSDTPEHGRKVVYRVIPPYPQLAKQMQLRGTVRLMAVVAPNGTVKFIEPIGGNPLLVKSAEDAVMQWKYAAAPAESKEPVELRFSPE